MKTSVIKFIAFAALVPSCGKNKKNESTPPQEEQQTATSENNSGGGITSVGLPNDLFMVTKINIDAKYSPTTDILKNKKITFMIFHINEKNEEKLIYKKESLKEHVLPWSWRVQFYDMNYRDIKIEFQNDNRYKFEIFSTQTDTNTPTTNDWKKVEFITLKAGATKEIFLEPFKN